jgi:CHAT domain-containing protein/tetratricopeptide (TPR) repeat protein
MRHVYLDGPTGKIQGRDRYMLPNHWRCWLSACLLFTLSCDGGKSVEAGLAGLGSYRPCQARLTTELGYARCTAEPLAESATRCGGELPGVAPLPRWRCSPLPRPGSKAFQTLVRAGAEAFARVSPAAAPDLLRAATLRIFGQPDEPRAEQAAAWLRRGLAVASDRESFLADLGAVHLILAERGDRSEDLLRSIEYSEQALEERPAAAGPRYNLALALSQLGLTGPATAEWRRFLAGKHTGPWENEARSWLRSLPSADGDPLHREITGQLAAAVEGSRPEALLAAGRRTRQLTREWIENELLKRWAEARLAGEEKTAARILTAARLLASNLAAATGDRLLTESVAAISGAAPPQQWRLALGHRAFAEAIPRLYRETQVASEKLGEAERQLGPDPKTGWAGSPFVVWARFNQALTLNIDQQFFKAEMALAALARQVDATRYPALAGRIHWIRGLATSNLGRVEDSKEHYREAARIFCRLGETQNLAATQGLLAAGEHKLGHYEAAWTLTRNALARRGSIFNLGRLQAILQDAAYNADRQGLSRAGLYFADEFVAVAERERSPWNRYNALLRRAALRETLGQLSGARADSAAAERILPSLSSQAQFERAKADGAFEDARRQPAAMMDEVMAPLTEAIEYYRKTDNQQRLPEAYGLRAQGNLARGRVDLAESDLKAEARALENTLFAASPGPLRQARILVLQDFFDHMIEFQTVHRHDAIAAFRFAEQQRHWALWEWARTVAPGSGGSPLLGDPLATASWADLQAVRGRDMAIVSYHVLPHQVLLWVSGPRGSRMASLPVDREALRSRLTALLAAARGRDVTALRPAAEALHEILIAPVAASIRGASLVLIVPDRMLQELPFGLLRDPSTGRYFYESHALIFSPSATAYVRLHYFGRSANKNTHRLLAVAATRGERPALLPLPYAAGEAKAVAAQWPGGEALSFGEQAPLRRHMALADAFHFAGHAIAGPDTLRLVFHDDAARPLQLTAADILSEDFPHLRLVSLSGCRTADIGAAGRIGSPSAGFVRSFLASGVLTVIASFLDLDDRRARDVFPAFYRRLARGEDAAVAMQRTCIEQPIENRDKHALLCGSLAVYGLSSQVAGEMPAKVRLPKHN